MLTIIKQKELKDLKFLICKHCGNMVTIVKDMGVPIICCGEPMTALQPNRVDASQEKHVPSVTVSGASVIVNIGEAPHPMLDEHHIEWVALETKHGKQFRRLSPCEHPKATFLVEDDTPVAAYAYCNLHGLWKTDIPV